jgi:hypothetical protein
MKSYSQSRQDLFVAKMLQEKRNGFYVEVGGNDPVVINNTYVFETDFDWKGLSVEINGNLVAEYNKVRKNPCFQGDAVVFPYELHLDKMLEGSNRIDYLSLDIEPGIQSYNCLLKIPHEKFRFSVITFEHEMYREGPQVRDMSRKFLADLGYQLVVGNVMNLGNPYEDWYVDPTVVDERIWKQFLKSDIEHSDIGL